jgi:hypothetical protein
MMTFLVLTFFYYATIQSFTMAVTSHLSLSPEADPDFVMEGRISPKNWWPFLVIISFLGRAVSILSQPPRLPTL